MRISLENALKRKLLVDVLRPVYGVTDIEGFILASSQKWLLLSDTERLTPDGYWLFRRDTVSSIRSTVYQEFRHGVLRREKLLKAALHRPAIDLTSISTILQWLQGEGECMVVRTETKKGERSLHCRIDEINNPQADSLFLGLDGAGRWDTSRTVVHTGRITSIHFGSRYLNLYRNHAAKQAARSPIRKAPSSKGEG